MLCVIMHGPRSVRADWVVVSLLRCYGGQRCQGGGRVSGSVER